MKYIKSYLKFVLLIITIIIITSLFIISFMFIIGTILSLCTLNFLDFIIMFVIALVSTFLAGAALDIAEWMNKRGMFN